VSIAERPSILVLRLSALGDVIHAMPAVVALRDALPHARIGWVVESPCRELVEDVAPVDRVFAISTKKWRKEWSARATREEIFEFRAQLRAFAREGTSIDFQGLMKSSLLGFFSGASTRYGFASDAVREKPSVLFTNRCVPIDRARHVIEWNMQLARAAGARMTEPPALDFSRFEREPAALAGIAARPPVIISPATGRPEKNWSVENFVEVARGLKEDGHRVVTVWGPGEQDLAARIAEESATELAPTTTLRELAFILKRARAMLAGDTGPLHLAAALGTPVVGIYGPTDPARNGPWGQIQRCVESWTTTRDIRSVQARSVLETLRETFA
jgi:lipopolysaccharide heptosyltransferase I